MRTLSDLRAAASSKLATVHSDVTAYITALEAKVSSNKLTWYAIGAAVAVIAIMVIVHKLKAS